MLQKNNKCTSLSLSYVKIMKLIRIGILGVINPVVNVSTFPTHSIEDPVSVLCFVVPVVHAILQLLTVRFWQRVLLEALGRLLIQYSITIHISCITDIARCQSIFQHALSHCNLLVGVVNSSVVDLRLAVQVITFDVLSVLIASCHHVKDKGR